MPSCELTPAQDPNIGETVTGIRTGFGAQTASPGRTIEGASAVAALQMSVPTPAQDH